MTITNNTGGRGTILNSTTDVSRVNAREVKQDRGARRSEDNAPTVAPSPRDVAIDDLHADLLRGNTEESLVVFRSILGYFQEGLKTGDGRTDLKDSEARQKAVDGLSDLFVKLRSDTGSLTQERFLTTLQLVFNPTTVAVGGGPDMMLFLTDLEGALRRIENSTS